MRRRAPTSTGRPPNPTSRAARAGSRGLPPPTPSEAAFEALLARFDELADAPPDAAAERDPAGEVAAFVDGLFARGGEFLERAREKYGSIGDSDAFNSKVVGVSFDERPSIAGGLFPGAPLDLVREPANAHDANAIAVRYGALQVGYIRRDIAKHIAPNIDGGDRYDAVVLDVTGGGDRNTGVNIRVTRHRVSPGLRFSSAGAGAALGLLEHDSPVERIRHALIGDKPIRDPQLRVLERIAAGDNVLAVLGTGRGKSFCFQMPAADRALRERRKTLVFYPLRALANDQHAALVRRLAPLGVRVLRANGSIDGDERDALDVALADGSWDVVLATPEFASYHRDAFARTCNRPALVVVDEAHLLLESRHRAAYAEFGGLLDALGRPQVLALTATADKPAFAEIRAVLGIDRWVIDKTVRDNLHVVDARGEEKAAYLQRILDGDGKAIVYCNSRSDATSVAGKLRVHLGSGVAFYHAGVPSRERAEIENLFREGALRVIVATSAFGEGIDLPDVRDVVLYHLNFALTEFNQQSGRAGRDGAPARIHLLYDERDKAINEFLIDLAAPRIETLRELYRGMRALASADLLRMTYEDIARTLDLKRVRGDTVSSAVQIWLEAGLVESGRDEDGRFIRFLDVGAKVDLTTTPRYVEGVAERDSFQRFCALALEADAASLEQIINRPIYPDGVPLER
jgi:single-stranded-DNA-specific exonuclease